MLDVKSIPEYKIKRKISNNSESCGECGGDLYFRNDYQSICRKCGIIDGIEIVSQDYVYYSKESIKTHYFNQSIFIGKSIDKVDSLGTYIDFQNRNTKFEDINRKYISPEMQRTFSRIKRTYCKFDKIKNHETEYRVLNHLSIVCKILHINDQVRKMAAFNYRKIKSRDEVHNNVKLIAFCLYVAVKKNHLPITIQEISYTFKSRGCGVSPGSIIREGINYKKIFNPQTLKSENYLERFTSDIAKLPNLEDRLLYKSSKWSIEEYRTNLYNQSLSLLKNINKYQRGGRNPIIFAAASIYCSDKIIARKSKQKFILTQNMISKATSVPKSSITDHYISFFKPYLKKIKENKKNGGSELK